MSKDQLVVKRVYWPKILMFVFAIVLPQGAVAWSNREVFPDALWIATIFVIVIIGISGISTYFSGNADPKTRRYAMWHDFAIAALTCVVALFHFQVAREVSAGKDARTVQQQKEKDGQEYADRDTDRKLALAKADTERLREQRRLAIQLPPDQRRLLGAGQPVATPTPFTTAITKPAETAVIVKSPEEVRASWFAYLFWASAFEIIVAVLGGMLLMMIWQWDVDGDGIADSVKPPVASGQPMGFAQGVPVTAKTDTKPSGGNIYYPTDLGK